MGQAADRLPSGVAVRAARPGKRRSLWWVVHQWAGLQVSLFLSFVLLTGTLAVFSYEMDWLTRPAMWAAPTPVAERVGFGEAGSAIQAMAPERRLHLLMAPVHPAATFDAYLENADGAGFTHVYVHPRTGEVTGEGGWLGVQRFLRSTHRHLMLPVKWGVMIVSVAALLLLVSLVTSFKVYKKWWRGFARLPKGKTARAWIGDAHRIMGVWSLWFVVVIIATSFWYLAEQTGAAAPTTFLEQTGIEDGTAGLNAAPATPNEALDIGMKRLAARSPDFRPTMVFWPTEALPFFQVRGEDTRAILVRPRANTVRIDPVTGALLSQTDPTALSAHQRIAEAADPLHFGTFGGYWTKAIWFVFGAALSALSMTGVAIYAMRIRKEAGWSPQRFGGVRDAWLAMGWGRWLALGLVLLPLVLAPIVM